MRRRWLLVVVLLAVVALAGCDWSQLGFDPGKSNFNPGEPALTPSAVTHLGTAWSKPCFCNQTLVADGDVFTIDGFDPSHSPIYTLTVRALQASTGNPVWSLPLGQLPGAQLLAVGNGVVYMTVNHTTGSDQLIGLDEGNGSVRFTITPPAPGTAVVSMGLPDPLAGRLLIVSAWRDEGSEVSAIDPDGHVVWSHLPGGFVDGLAASPDGVVYASSVIHFSSPPPFGSVVPILTGYRESDGAGMSQVVVGGQVTTNWSPLTSFGNGLAYGAASTAHGGSGAGGEAVDPTTGNVVHLGGTFVGAVSPTAAVLQDDENDVFAVNPKTGTQLWTRFFAGPVDVETRAIAGSLVYVGLSTNFVMLDLATGNTVATSPALPDRPFSIVPSGGRIFVTAGGATLVALQPT